jgi:hypothetical protein
MNSKQTVYNILASKPLKTELALVDDVNQDSYLLESYANDILVIKKQMQESMRRLESIQADGIQKFKSLSSMQNELESKFKELGLEASSNAAYKKAEDALNKWSDANSLKI